ncbi:fimbria/pilus outer membrane usher protein [Breoghania sp.]|uniref:fimbria/pilus outer membrane usher protein n=1 Tax=Breoghania sp. TaxID=2065378 RepID=UPI00260DE9A6|nr:fimbria/pilus outer membrane usher protein [Breoghania sp.]MDJ0932315.1 fimbria/pilus outer membrane usher protein [Breoghania sp.]
MPSSVEIYLNNVRRFSKSVQADPFNVIDMPVTTGADEVRVVVTDENGNSTVTKIRFFVSDRLLSPHLLDYSFEVGVPRTGYGTSHDSYTDRVYGSASLRYGLTNYLTFESHAEAGRVWPGGAGLAWSLGPWGVMTPCWRREHIFRPHRRSARQLGAGSGGTHSPERTDRTHLRRFRPHCLARREGCG